MNGHAPLWGVYLAATLAAPKAWLHQPAFKLLDAIIWPAVAAMGKPLAVAAVAVAFAAVTLFGQWLLTDNRRLREAKRRARLLKTAAGALPADSPRRKAMDKLAAAVTGRLLVAALTPMALILGPMMMTFFWFPERMDPGAWNADPGSAVTIVAEVDGGRPIPLTLGFGEGVGLDEATPATQTTPPVRATLQALRADWAAGDLTKYPQALQTALAELGDDGPDKLAAYLRAAPEPQSLMWTLHSAPDQAGRARVSVSVDEGHCLYLDVVFGDALPPQPTEVFGEDDSPLKSIRAVYAQADRKRMFWAPLAGFGSDWDAGWLLTYLIAYLPAMFALKLLLRLP